ncbi:MAG: peptidoglycan bridge formation glycyltransferase FemA/FemB family protein [Spirochaetia bacterium]
MNLIRIDPSRLEPLNTPMQSFLWAQVKSNLGIPPIAFRLEDGKTMLVLMRRTGRGESYAYVPWPEYGYQEPEARGQLLEESAKSLAPLLPAECVFIRFDLAWETPYEAGEDSADFNTGDGRPPQRLRELRMNFGTKEKNLRKAPTDIQPADTLVLDTEKNERELLGEMKPKTRYNIRLSQRRGVVVKDEPIDKLEQWYRIYRETAERKGFTLHDYRNFEELLKEEALHGSRYRAKVHLLMAEDGEDHTPLAGIILLRIGTYAMYLYGASRREGKNLMPSYGLQWEAIKLAKACGCSTYDLFGIPPTPQISHPMHGLYRFKRGFGGRIEHRQGCWDYPLDTEKYRHICGSEPTGPSYHL